jgi:predicted Rossmann fold flavoprotein
MAKSHGKSSKVHSDGIDNVDGISGPEVLDEEYDLIIIGAGPSGLFCAVNSSQNERKIIILEKKDSPGRKLLISGSGQCNITNEKDIHFFLDHYGDNSRFLRPALLGFTNLDLISFFEEKGLKMVVEKGGKVFPATFRSKDVLNILLEECRVQNVQIKSGLEVSSIERTGDRFEVYCGNNCYYSRLLVIAAGGCSYPGTGSTGDGFKFARNLGHRIVDVGPALTPVFIKDYPFFDLAGISFSDMKISLYRKKKIKDHQGDILITHQGLSGPGILDLSRYIRAGDTLKLSFIPREKRDSLEEWLQERTKLDGKRAVRSVLSDIPYSVPLSPRLAKRILEISGIETDLILAHLTKGMRTSLIDNLTGFDLVVSELAGYNQAMVTRGGVDTTEVNPKTMESRIVKGLYLVGEVLDVDGDTGGYNLQAAFSTGVIAARSIKNNYKSNSVRPSHPKGWGMLQAACPVFRSPEIVESSLPRSP